MFCDGDCDATLRCGVWSAFRLTTHPATKPRRTESVFRLGLILILKILFVEFLDI
jgi:hypothetical protein